MLKLEIYDTGSAFDFPRPELVRILRELADRIESHDAPTMLRDLNGNRCGTVNYTEAAHKLITE